MTDHQLLKDVVEWDVHNWSAALEHWRRFLDASGTSSGRVLCLGERNGGISLWFALRGFEVVCTDRKGPTDTARALHARYGVSDRIEYAEANIFELPYADDSFDIVACKSVIGGLKLDTRDKSTRTLENQKLALDEARRVLRPGGWFFGAENMRGSLLHRVGRKIKRRGNLGWRHLATSETGWLFRDFSEIDVTYFGFLGSYYPSETVNRVASLVDAGLARVLPRSWMYICFIAARK